MSSCPWCSSSRLSRHGRDERGRVVYACAGCGRHATTESASLVSGHRFPRDIILLAVRYYLQLGAAAERIAGVLADRGLDVSGRTILRWVQKFGPALAQAVRQHRARPVTTWLVDETYVKILGKWHYICIAVLTSMARCSTVGWRPRATCPRLRRSFDEPSLLPVVFPGLSSPTKRRSTRARSALGRPTPSTRRPAFTTG